MNPGDRVRFLRSSGQGVIRKLNKDNTVDVEIEEGFTIPVLKSEIVVIASEEKEIFRSAATEKEPIKQVTFERTLNQVKGLYLAFNSFNDKIYSIEFLNSTEHEILLAVSEFETDLVSGLIRDIVKPGGSLKIGERNIGDFDKWQPLLLQLIFFSFKQLPVLNTITRKISFNPATFFKSKKKHPFTGKEAYVFQIDLSEKELQPEKLQERLNEGRLQTEISVYNRPASEYDLHIEKLDNNWQKMKPEQILNFQFQTFEKAFENAIASGMQEITFIHGVGNGVLRNMIHKFLSQSSEIDYYKDAQKEKFGYGATYIKFK